MNKLSHTSITEYLECGEKYRLNRIEKIRPVKIRSPLAFGKAIDDALNDLLLTKDVASAKSVFDIVWQHQKINGVVEDLEKSDKVLFSKSDVDGVMLLGKTYTNEAWTSLQSKAYLMIDTYAAQILPLIKEVIVVQKPINIKNADGDEITGVLDLIVEFHDGTRYLMDNKTSSVDYDGNSGAESPQLKLYYYVEKENYKLDGVGFFVLNKKVNKNEKRTCLSCGTEESSRQVKGCRANSPPASKRRCNGEFKIDINPTIDFQIIKNKINEATLEDVLDSFDKANHGIANKEYVQNFSSCYGKFGPCQYIGLCKKDSMDGLIKLESK